MAIGHPNLFGLRLMIAPHRIEARHGKSGKPRRAEWLWMVPAGRHFGIRDENAPAGLPRGYGPK
jgi:hypothetical protein